MTQATYDDMFMSYTNRPPTQSWHLRAGCVHVRPVTTNGNIVTGNGTSSVANCAAYTYFPAFVVDP